MYILTLDSRESKINENCYELQNQKGIDMMKKYLSACWNLMFLLLLLHMDVTEWNRIGRKDIQEEDIEVQVEEKNKTYLGSDGYLKELLSLQNEEALVNTFGVQEQESYPELEESGIYSFLQGPRSYQTGISWSGEWCGFSVEGNTFGSFGCGLCCMANVYDTLSPYEVSPWDMFEYAKRVSNYGPSGESGAISWKNMKSVLQSCGITCYLFHKPGTYAEFQNQVEQMQSAIVLVSSREDNTFWLSTLGHYVNIWMYRREDDTVFLAEPGSPENNRRRIPLRYVYNALKTASSFQYLAVTGYEEERNRWKADGIDEIWHSP